jgi:hypothetical protein
MEGKLKLAYARLSVDEVAKPMENYRIKSMTRDED